MRVSILITSYNQRDYLREAIDSALNQTHPAHEIIIVDDASSDGSQDLIADYARRYPDVIRPIYHATNTGVTQARNDALEIVTGDYVSILDGDDLYYPQKLELELARLAEVPEARIAFSNFEFVDADGHYISRWVDDEPVPEGDLFLAYFGHRLPKRQSFRSDLVHYESWQRVGFYDFNDIWQVFDMRVQLTKQLPCVYVPQILSSYRVLNTGLSSNKPSRHIEALEALYRKNSPLLETLPARQRQRLRHDYKTYLAMIARDGLARAVKQSPIPRREALRLWWLAMRYEPTQPRLVLLLRALLPPAIYSQLRRSKP